MSEFDEMSRSVRSAGTGTARGGTCSISGSPFTTEELALLDRFRALRVERRQLAARQRASAANAPEPAAGASDGDALDASLARIREIDAEAERLHQQAGNAWRRRMIALGYLDPDREPLVSLDELRRR